MKGFDMFAFFTRQSKNLDQLSDTLARYQLTQVEANPEWFAKYEEYCGAKGVEAVRATPGYAKLYQTMQSLFMTILTPGLPTSDIAERMAKTHQRIEIKFEWFLAACQNLEDDMRKLKIHPALIERFRVFVRQVAKHYERALEAARQEALVGTDELKKLFAKLRVIANAVSQSAHELAEAQRNLANRVEHDAANIEEISAVLEEVDATFNNMQDNAQETLNSATMVANTAKMIQETMADTVNLIQTIAQETKGTERILKTIRDISFQTNILALNASVEAARAGQHGRGFDVIAVEIRKLSNRVSTEAQTIAASVSKLLESTGKGESSITKTAGDLAQIATAIDLVSERMKDTTNAIGNSKAGFSQVREAIVSIEQSLQGTIAMVQEISATADSLLDQAKQMSQQSGLAPVDLSEAPQDMKHLSNNSQSKSSPRTAITNHSVGSWQEF
jgi:methyl-accepting chemotaxis protein